MYGYAGQRRRRRARLIGAGVALLAAAGLVTGGAYVLGQTSAGSAEDGPSTGQLAVPVDVDLPPLPAAAPSDDPVKSAVAWLTATRSQRFDEAPSAWIDRVKPVVTPRLAEEHERYREGTVGVGWESFVRDRCATTVLFDGPGGVIPEEAPRTRTSVSVQVVGSVQTLCQTEGSAENKPPVAVAATLLLRQFDGQWLVDFQQY